MLEEFIEPSHHPEHAGMSYHPEGGVVSHVGLVPHGGSVVHANHALGTIDLRAGSGAQDVAGACNQCTGTAMKAHIFVSSDWQVTVSPAPFLQVSGPQAIICRHMERSVGLFNHIVRTKQDEECHEDEGGC